MLTNKWLGETRKTQSTPCTHSSLVRVNIPMGEKLLQRKREAISRLWDSKHPWLLMILKMLRMGCLQDGWSLKRRGCQLRLKDVSMKGAARTLSEAEWLCRCILRAMQLLLLQAACRRHKANFKVTWQNSSSQLCVYVWTLDKRFMQCNGSPQTSHI